MELLDKYGDDDQITSLLDSREIYFVPVVSPDSYPTNREVDGVDPNRDFPTDRDPNKQSVTPVAALQQFFLDIKPNAVISGHTFGRVFLTPWGSRTQICDNESDYQRIIGEMAKKCGYKMMRCCFNYGQPIFGTEVDWYYKNGAFAIVMEFGTHQRRPSNKEINQEFDRTFDGILYFIKEGAEVNVR